MHDANVTISRLHGGEEKLISISISDASSGVNVVKVAMTLETFAECLTGLAHSKATFERPPTQKMIDVFGKEREVASIWVEKNNDYGDKGRELTETTIDIEAQKPEWEGWAVSSYGTRRQQPSKKHQGTMVRYVEEKK